MLVKEQMNPVCVTHLPGLPRTVLVLATKALHLRKTGSPRKTAATCHPTPNIPKYIY